MRFKFLQVRSLLSLAVFVALLSGCGQTDNKSVQAKEKDAMELPDDQKREAKSGHDHSGWWCDEHGVPEGECSMCSARVAAEFKKKGDWCEKHDRAKSQCFICDPSLEAKYAVRYEAKYGKKPSVPEENRPKKEEEKKN